MALKKALPSSRLSAVIRLEGPKMFESARKNAFEVLCRATITRGIKSGILLNRHPIYLTIKDAHN